MIGWRLAVRQYSERRSRWLRTSRVPTDDALESIGEVGVEMLDGNVASEVTVGGLDGIIWDCSVPTRKKDESMDELDSDIVSYLRLDLTLCEERKKKQDCGDVRRPS